MQRRFAAKQATILRQNASDSEKNSIFAARLTEITQQSNHGKERRQGDDPHDETVLRLEGEAP
jgi:hypothetical protein